jgi:hypothetical protein
MKKMLFVTVASTVFLAAPAFAQTPADFYKGKTVDMVIGFSVGGGYDVYARTVARFMGEQIPGKPRIVPKNMTGAGSRVAANFVYNVAPKDGTVLATADQSMPLEQAVGDAGITFDTRKFTWIGTPIFENNTLVTWHTSPVKTVEDAKRLEVAVGATGFNTSAQYPQVMNSLLGTKFKIIMGYPGGNEINLAMENGEVAGRGSNNWTSWKSTKPDWIRDKKINILVQIGLTKAADLPDVPLLMDLAKNEDDRLALKLVSAPPMVGRPVFSTPNVPDDRTKALRDAFDATMKDPAFLEEAKKTGLDINPIGGVELQKIVADIIDTPKPVRDRLASILSLIDRDKK